MWNSREIGPQGPAKSGLVKDDIESMHRRGMRFLEMRQELMVDAGQPSTDWSELAKLAQDGPGGGTLGTAGLLGTTFHGEAL